MRRRSLAVGFAQTDVELRAESCCDGGEGVDGRAGYQDEH